MNLISNYTKDRNVTYYSGEHTTGKIVNYSDTFSRNIRSTPEINDDNKIGALDKNSRIENVIISDDVFALGKYMWIEFIEFGIKKYIAIAPVDNPSYTYITVLFDDEFDDDMFLMNNMNLEELSNIAITYNILSQLPRLTQLEREHFSFMSEIAEAMKETL
jgi:hypothetical protein